MCKQVWQRSVCSPCPESVVRERGSERGEKVCEIEGPGGRQPVSLRGLECRWRVVRNMRWERGPVRQRERAGRFERATEGQNDKGGKECVGGTMCIVQQVAPPMEMVGEMPGNVRECVCVARNRYLSPM